MEVIGLTGGIGSGKTTIAKMFESLNIPVYYADIEAKKLMNTSNNIKIKLIDLFGDETFIDESLNRSYIANIVFKDKEKLQKLNAIVHPEVERHFHNWIKNQNSKYVIQENAIIFENENQSKFDKMITVTASKDLRVNRVMQRDAVSESMVLDRMKNQLKDSYKINNSDFVIYNTDLKQSKDQVLKIHKDLID
ncbi:MAG: dephospho-CoA kinase [Flavobacteriaceae bacterium]|nr:dephospho-CoA kinase [Flavobacteriaceae bacterium]